MSKPRGTPPPEYALNPTPCASCPYRRDCPPGVWAPEEYAMLRPFDTNETAATFLCHQTLVVGKDTLCRGWLTVHRENVAVRLLGMRGIVTWEEIYQEPTVPLYASGNEAADAGLAGVPHPDQRARRMIERLATKGVFKERRRRGAP